MKTAKKVIFISIVLLCLLGSTFLFRDSLIINFGIRGYKRVQIVLCVFIIICIPFILIPIFKDISNRKKEQLVKNDRQKNPYDTFLEEISQTEVDWVILKKKLDEKKEFNLEKIKDLVDKILNSSRVGLDLLKNNHIDYLYDTIEILCDTNKEAILKCKQLLNFIKVLDEPDEIQEKIKKTEDFEYNLKEQVDGFLYTITEYINNKEDKESSVEKINIYKKTLQQYINVSGG